MSLTPEETGCEICLQGQWCPRHSNEAPEEDIEQAPEVRLHDSGRKFEVCPICEGEGKYVNPNIDSQGITEDEMEELGEDFEEDYFAGNFDVTCKCCRGARVVTVEQLESYESDLEDLRVRMAEDGESYHDSRM